MKITYRRASLQNTPWARSTVLVLAAGVLPLVVPFGGSSILNAATIKFDGAGVLVDCTPGLATSWTAANSWCPNGTPTDVDDVVMDSSIVTTGLPGTMVVNGSMAMESLTFAANFNPTNTTTIGNDGATPATLTIGSAGTGGNPLIQVNSAAGIVTFTKRVGGGTADLGMALGASSSIQVDSGATLSIACAVGESGGAQGFTKTGDGIIELADANTYSGATAVSGGTLVVDGSISGTLTTAGGTVLAGKGSVGASSIGGTVSPAGATGVEAGTLTLQGLTLNSGADLKLDLASPAVIGGNVNDLVQVNGNLMLNNNPVTITPLAALAAGTYRLVNYTGTKSGNFNPTVLHATRYTLSLDESTPGQVNLVVSGSPADLRWNSQASSVWDVNGTPNWFNLGSASPGETFRQADTVLFDDTAGAQTSVTIGDGVTVIPGAFVINANANNYTISGAGRIGGNAALTKQGTSQLALNIANEFAGGVEIQAGTLRIDHAQAIPSGVGKGNVQVDGVLDLNGQSIFINGLSGAGTVRNSSASSASLGLGLADANVTFTGVIENGSGPVGLTKLGTGTIALSGLNTYSGSTTIDEGALQVAHANGLGNTSGSTKINGGITAARLELTGGITVSEPLALLMKKQVGASADPQVPHVVNTSGDNTLNGTFTLNSGPSGVGGTYWTFQSDAGKLTIASGLSSVASGWRILVLQGEAGEGEIQGAIQNVPAFSYIMLFKNGGGTWTLSGNNTYSGITKVYGGSLIVNGSLGSGTVTVQSPATLGGNGSINGAVSVQAGGTISAGVSIGTLTINNTLTLAGNAVMEINKSGATLTSDRIQGVSTLTCGGTLTVTATGDALAAGDVFDLFDAAAFSGSFATLNLPALGSGLEWDATQLTVDGTIRVAALPMVTISGTINYYSGIGRVVPGTTVTLSGDDSQVVITGSDGKFSFIVAAVGNYTVTPSKGGTAQEQVTVGDFGQIRLHLLGTLLNTPYRLIAGNVNGVPPVTVGDFGQVRLCLLGTITSFPAGIWTFVPSDFTFGTPTNPWPFPTNRQYNNLVSDAVDQNFTAMKMGDVNGSWLP